MIKAIIFDNNGVLTDSDKERTITNFAKYFDIREKELAKVFDDFSKPLDDGSITTLDFYQRIADEFGKGFDKKELNKVHIHSYQPKDGMRELLLELRNNHDIALLTNFGDTFDIANERIWNYTEVFDDDKLFVSSKLKMKKPNHDIYLHALEKLGREPHETVFIDDRESNLVPARDLGMKTILFTSPAQCKNELQLLLEENNGKK